MSTATENRRIGYIEVLSHRNFLALWSGSLVGRTGDYLLSVAMIAFAYTLTGSSLYAGLVAAAFYIPIFLFAPLFGSIVDNNDRKRLMVVASLLQALFGLILYFSLAEGFMVIALTFISVFLISTFGLVVSISRTSSIPLTVAREELTSANSLQQTTSQFSRIFGYAAGGVLFVLLGQTQGIVLLVVGTSFISAAFFATMKFDSPVAEGKSRKSLDGLKYVRKDSLFFEITVFLTIVNFTGAGMILLPEFMSNDIFHTGSAGYALILVVLAIGTILGNYIVTMFRARQMVGKIMIASILANAVLYILFAFSSFYVALGFTFVIGIVEGISSVPFIALLQARTPGDWMGSVIAAVSMLLLGGASASMLISGGLVAILGVQMVYVLFALLLFAIAAAGFAMKELREAAY